MTTLVFGHKSPDTPQSIAAFTNFAVAAVRPAGRSTTVSLTAWYEDILVQA